MEPCCTEAVVANPKLRLPGQRGRRRRSGDREEGFPSLVQSVAAAEGPGVGDEGWILTRGRYDTGRVAIHRPGGGRARRGWEGPATTTDGRPSTTDGESERG